MNLQLIYNSISRLFKEKNNRTKLVYTSLGAQTKRDEKRRKSNVND